ncbi:MAG: MBL fold metallo-hydrolase, partial [Clostridia bacterium]|nr:MBL fold metallo-hydrolase [Clostridia bacterium]
MIKTIEGGLLGSNTYVIYNEVGGSAMIVDCGCKAFSSVDFVNKSGLTVKYIVLTHGHFDHAEYTCEYVSAFPDAEIICHVDELKVLLDPNANLSSFVSEGKPYRFS